MNLLISTRKFHGEAKCPHCERLLTDRCLVVTDTKTNKSVAIHTQCFNYLHLTHEELLNNFNNTGI